MRNYRRNYRASPPNSRATCPNTTSATSYRASSRAPTGRQYAPAQQYSSSSSTTTTAAAAVAGQHHQICGHRHLQNNVENDDPIDHQIDDQIDHQIDHDNHHHYHHDNDQYSRRSTPTARQCVPAGVSAPCPPPASSSLDDRPVQSAQAVILLCLVRSVVSRRLSRIVTLDLAFVPSPVSPPAHHPRRRCHVVFRSPQP